MRPRASSARQSSKRHPSFVTAAGHSRILAVDDDPAILSLIQSILESADLKVYTAKKGEEAIALFQCDPKIGLIVVDWQMPGLNGVQLIDRLRVLRPGVRVIVSSGAPGGAVERAFVGREGIQFLSKPYTLRTLVMAVRSALGLSRENEAA